MFLRKKASIYLTTANGSSTSNGMLIRFHCFSSGKLCNEYQVLFYNEISK